MGFKPGRTHVGIVLYSKVAEVALKFGRHPHLRKLFRSIQDLPHRKDLTRIDLGLQTANTSLFSKEGGMRENVTKIAILLTDGKQTVDNVSDLIPVRDAAEAIKQRNIPIFAIGIGRSVDRDELLEIVGSEDKLIEAKSFEQLQKEVDQIANVSCKVAGKSIGSCLIGYSSTSVGRIGLHLIIDIRPFDRTDHVVRTFLTIF